MRAKHHLLMKMTSNPFRKESLQRMSPKGNPFRVFQSELDPYSHGDVSPSKMKAVHCSTETEPTQDERMHPLFLYLVQVLRFWFAFRA